MRDYVITTDDNSDLPQEFFREHGVGCAYFSYYIDDKHYTYGNFLPVKEFYDRMRNGSLPTTAQVNPEDVKSDGALPERGKGCASYCLFFRPERRI